jgi:uncharacterized membrane protein
MMQWLYTCVVRPVLKYAAVVWWHKVSLTTMMAGLDHLQRLACVSITGSMSMTPTPALEVVLGLMLLHLVAEADSRALACRFSGIGI